MPTQDGYVADEHVQEWIDDPPSKFYRGYHNWKDTGGGAGNPAYATMVLYFNAPEVKEKLDMGLGGNTHGGVLEDEYPAFNDFLTSSMQGGKTYTIGELRDLGINATTPHVSGSDPDQDFEIALRKYFNNQAVSDQERWVLNGALIVKVDLKSLNIGSNSDHKLFVIRGYDVMSAARNTNDVFWLGVEQKLDQAFKILGTHLINVTGVAQLRYGEGNEPFGPIKVAPGFEIRGHI